MESVVDLKKVLAGIFAKGWPGKSIDWTALEVSWKCNWRAERWIKDPLSIETELKIKEVKVEKIRQEIRKEI